MSNLQIWSRRTRKPRSSQFSLDEVYIENSGSIKHKKGSLKCTTCIDSDHAMHITIIIYSSLGAFLFLPFLFPDAVTLPGVPMSDSST